MLVVRLLYDGGIFLKPSKLLVENLLQILLFLFDVLGNFLLNALAVIHNRWIGQRR